MVDIRHAFDTDAGLILATTLHTLGAIGVVAALVAHMAWYRKLRDGVHHQGLYIATFWLTLNAILANLVGGLMRTYLPGHPGLTDIAASPWVQVMLLKHAFIFAALGALLFLHHRFAPRMLRRFDQGEAPPARTPTGHAVGVTVVILGVVVASALGGLAQITPLGEGYEDDGDHDGGPVTIIEDESGEHTGYHNASGTLTTNLAAAQPSSGEVQVDPVFTQVQATLIWTPSQYDLRLQLTDGAGAVVEAGADGDGRRAVTTPVAPGTLRYAIDSDLAVNAQWELSLIFSSVAGNGTFLAETVTVASGTFFEINTQMPGNGTFHWDWSTSQEVAFDVHSHFDDEVQYHVEKTTDADRGSFTNDREGGYSLLWENTGNAPVTLEYRVWGEFEVDSYFPPR